MTYRIGVDVGGTFTDFVRFNTLTGEIQTLKLPTSLQDQSIAITQGILQLCPDLSLVLDVAHGTTTATNALIERNGAKTAFLTTKGFRDQLEIRRTDREDLYSGRWVPPPPLVARRHRLEINERIRADGSIDTPLDEKQVNDVIETLRVRDIEAVAICFLHSYMFDLHEKKCKEMIQRALPGVYVTCSSDVSQEFREFERGSTVAANAMVGPIIKRYMSNLTTRLKGAGLTAEVAILQSNGGVCTAEEAGELPVKLARSGPAGGAMALRALAEMCGYKNLVGIDIGGTSADVCVIVDGQPRWASPLVVEWGMPLLTPSVDIICVGAGGGSIAHIDAAGGLHMGPQSAGSNPGPACYAKGGVNPTSTDAQIVLGRLDPNYFADGTMKIDSSLSHKAVKEVIAEKLGMDVPRAAEGMLKIMESNMVSAVRYVTVEKGYDPREFALVGFGGGGPLYAVALAKDIGMTSVIIPNNPGVMCAWGTLVVDMKQDRSQTVLKRRSALREGELEGIVMKVRDKIFSSFARQGISSDKVTLEYILDLQYTGQVFSLAVSLGTLAARTNKDNHSNDVVDGGINPSEEGVMPVKVAVTTDADGTIHISSAALDEATKHFHVQHKREYGHADPNGEIQIVHARVFGSVKVANPKLIELPLTDGKTDRAIKTTRDCIFDGVTLKTNIYRRGLLRQNDRIDGPAIIEEPTTTTVLPPYAFLVVDKWGNMICKYKE